MVYYFGINTVIWYFLSLTVYSLYLRVLRLFFQCRLKRWPTFKLLCMCCTPFCCHSPQPRLPTPCLVYISRPPLPSLIPTPHLLPAPCAPNLREISILRTGSSGLQWGNCCNEVLEYQSAARAWTQWVNLNPWSQQGSKAAWLPDCLPGRCNFDIIFDKLLTNGLPNCWVNKSWCWFFDLVT